MKIRVDFVTNSSSSSFICVAKVSKTDKLIEYLKEEYGKYGVRTLDEYIINGKDIKDDESCQYEEFTTYCKENDIEIKDDDCFLIASFIAYTNEGDTDGDDAWLYRHIPDEYMEEIYEGEAY